MKFKGIEPDETRVGCSSAKKGYATEHEVLEAAAHSEDSRGVRLGIYHCPECLHWHLTSRAR